MIVFLDVAMAQGADVRDEIKKYGKEGTAKRFNEMQSARRDFILKQRVKRYS